jgi:hypothetical protein
VAEVPGVVGDRAGHIKIRRLVIADVGRVMAEEVGFFGLDEVDEGVVAEAQTDERSGERRCHLSTLAADGVRIIPGLLAECGEDGVALLCQFFDEPVSRE